MRLRRQRRKGARARVKHRLRVRVCSECKHPIAMHGRTAAGRSTGCKARRGTGRCDCEGTILVAAAGGMKVHKREPWSF